MTRGRSTLRPRLPGCGRCSSAPIGRGAGLGRRILEACEAAARDEGFRELTLVATLPGVPLYLAYGFQPVDELEVEMPDGIKIDCVSMRKPVGDADHARTAEVSDPARAVTIHL